ncbi:MAG: aminotransferase class I/II-fold pyridoxal phosphate-dependent enzyme, partial [Verrucomicrobiota bacterium]
MLRFGSGGGGGFDAGPTCYEFVVGAGVLGLAEAFKKDPSPVKIDLSAGVYRDATGKTPVFHSVKRAEERILKQETSKNYLGIQGSAEYAAAVQRLVFGQEHEILASRRVTTVH